MYTVKRIATEWHTLTSSGSPGCSVAFPLLLSLAHSTEFVAQFKDLLSTFWQFCQYRLLKGMPNNRFEQCSENLEQNSVLQTHNSKANQIKISSFSSP